MADKNGTLFGESPPPDRIVHIRISQLEPYPDHPFKLHDQEKLNEMMESFRLTGILQPLVVQPLPGGRYRVLAGHNRLRAAEGIGMKKVPCSIQDVDDATAAEIMANTNLLQREELLPSEKAFAYKCRNDLQKHQGQRNDLTLVQVAPKSHTTEAIARSEKISKDKIKRYIKLTALNPKLLQMVDDKILPFMAGYHLAFLESDKQEQLLELCQQYNIKKITLAMAEAIKASAGEDMESILGLKPTPSHVPKWKAGKATTQVLQKHFGKAELDDKSQASLIDKALGEYFERHGREI